MAKRIRYNKKTDGILESNVLVSNKGFRYVVRIDTNTMTYVIKNLKSERLIKPTKEKNLTNLNVLKANARDHAISLGVELGAESRDRTFGVVEKGMTQEKWESKNE